MRPAPAGRISMSGLLHGCVGTAILLRIVGGCESVIEHIEENSCESLLNQGSGQRSEAFLALRAWW
jgi:hypothetical protein